MKRQRLVWWILVALGGSGCVGDNTAQQGDSGVDANALPDASRGDVGADVSIDAVAESEPKTRTVFVTSTTWTGALGGLAGADAKCGAAAADAGIPGNYLAWVSTTTTTPSLRFTHSTAPYVLVDGTVVAADWDHLTGGVSLEHAIDRDEHDDVVGFDASANLGEVWTSTLADGTSALGQFPNGCADFTSADPNTASGLVGCTDATDSKWTMCAGTGCVVSAALYCFQQ